VRADADQVRPVVHGEVGLMVEGGRMCCNSFVVLSLDAWTEILYRAQTDAATRPAVDRMEAQSTTSAPPSSG